VSWHLFNEGRDIGQVGTEDGIIILDEEHSEGIHITLERDGRAAPFSITCGIYGWMFHTCFFSEEELARRAYEEMKLELVNIATRIPYEDDPDKDAKIEAIDPAIAAFIERFS
jgi:hypothetical protein